MFKKIITLGVALIMALSVVACGISTDCQSQLDELNEKLEHQTERITELEEGDAKQAEKIAELEKENKFLKDMIDELEDELDDLIGPGIESKFEGSGGGDPSSSVYAAYKTRTTVFKIDKVKIRFYYGMLPNDYPDGAYSIAKICVTSGSGQEFNRNRFDNTILLKQINDFHTEKYFINSVSSSFNDFNVSEVFTIPKEIFVGEIGWINIYISESDSDKDGGNSAGGSGFHFYYKVSGETVTLSTTWFED